MPATPAQYVFGVDLRAGQKEYSVTLLNTSAELAGAAALAALKAQLGNVLGAQAIVTDVRTQSSPIGQISEVKGDDA